MRDSNSQFATESGRHESVGCGSCENHVNVGQTERLVSAAIGGALLMSLANFRPVRGIVGAAVGAGLLYRAMTGHCHLYDALGINRGDIDDSRSDSESRRMIEGMEQSNRKPQARRSNVDIASDESFPASDPPAWTHSSAT